MAILSAPLSDDAVIKSNRLLDVLSTNATVRAIKATEAIRTNLEAVSDVRHRRDVIAAWKRSLLNIPVDRLPPSERYASVREAHSVLTWALVGAEWEIEPSYEKMWSVYFEALAWLDEQCKKMKPDGKQRITDIWVQKGKWDYYQALVEYRESAIENLELNGFDESLYNVEAARMDVVRRKFEKLIDRSVRPRKDIKLLGHYVKEVRVKVVRERDQALSLLNER